MLMANLFLHDQNHTLLDNLSIRGQIQICPPFFFHPDTQKHHGNPDGGLPELCFLIGNRKGDTGFWRSTLDIILSLSYQNQNGQDY